MTRFLLAAVTAAALAVPATSASAYEPFCGSLRECVTTCAECIGEIPRPLIGCWQTDDLKFCI